MPQRLVCRPERKIADETGDDAGRVDLVFTDPDGPFTLLVELKLHSGYGRIQLERYLSSLGGDAPGDRWLVAVTKSAPHRGESKAVEDPRWLGSVRWAAIVDDLMRLQLDERPVLEQGWRTLLALVCDQGDFGPMDFDPALVVAWAQRDRAERLMAHTLLELVRPTLTGLRLALGGAADAEDAVAILRKGPSQPVYTQKNRMLISFGAPVGRRELFRIQFLGWGDARFAAEARYQHPREQISGQLADAGHAAVALGLKAGRDGTGYHWKRGSVDVAPLASGIAAVDVLREEVEATIDLCARAGLLAALAAHTPTTPEAPEPLD